MRILEATYDSGVNFIDTADIYNDGNSEKAIGELLKKYPDHFYVVTKCGRGLNPPCGGRLYPGGYGAVCGRQPEAAGAWSGWTWYCCTAPYPGLSE